MSVIHVPGSSTTDTRVTASNPLPITGTFSTSVSGFMPTPAYAILAVTTTSSLLELPVGTTIIVYNTGASDVYIQLGNSSVVATTSNDLIKSGCWLSFSVGTAAHIAAITSSGTSSITVSGGSGLATGGGGSGGSGGSGGNVVVTSSVLPANASQETGGNLASISINQGAKADTAATDSTSSWSEIALSKGNFSKLEAIRTALTAVVPPPDSYAGIGALGPYYGLTASTSSPVILATVRYTGARVMKINQYTIQPAITSAFTTGQYITVAIRRVNSYSVMATGGTDVTSYFGAPKSATTVAMTGVAARVAGVPGTPSNTGLTAGTRTPLNYSFSSTMYVPAGLVSDGTAVIETLVNPLCLALNEGIEVLLIQASTDTTGSMALIAKFDWIVEDV